MSFFIKGFAASKQHYAAAKKGYDVGKTTYGKFGPPTPFGKKIFEHPNPDLYNHLKVKTWRNITSGWHCTNAATKIMKDQFKKGEFQNIGIDLYLAPLNAPDIAAHFGAMGRKVEKGQFEPCLLKVLYNGVWEENEQFGTYFIPRHRDEPVYILEGHAVSLEYLEYLSNPEARPGLKKIFTEAAFAAYQAYLKALEPRRTAAHLKHEVWMIWTKRLTLYQAHL